MELKDRERKVDVNKMSPEEVDVLSVQLGNKIRAICDEAVAKANEVLNIYGASAKMQIEINELPSEVAKAMDVGQESEKSHKNANLSLERLS